MAGHERRTISMLGNLLDRGSRRVDEVIHGAQP